MYRPILRLL